MGTSNEVPTVWNNLAETMYLIDDPTAGITMSELGSFSFARVHSTEGLKDKARPITGERGHIVALQLKSIPYMEQYLARKCVSSGLYQQGAVTAIDLQDEPSILLPNPFDALVIYVTQDALDQVAYDHGVPRIERMVWPYGGMDPVVHQLGQALLASLERPHHASKIFVDHLRQALNCHFVCTYGGVRVPTEFRGGLSPQQMRRASEFLEAHLSGDVALREVAAVCELSVSHFSRAFKRTFRKPPHSWLTERRVDRARDLMVNSRLPLADIAMRCGFGDQSAFNRSFKRRYGVSPGIWRRRSGCDASKYAARMAEL